MSTSLSSSTVAGDSAIFVCEVANRNIRDLRYLVRSNTDLVVVLLDTLHACLYIFFFLYIFFLISLIFFSLGWDVLKDLEWKRALSQHTWLESNFRQMKHPNSLSVLFCDYWKIQSCTERYITWSVNLIENRDFILKSDFLNMHMERPSYYYNQIIKPTHND